MAKKGGKSGGVKITQDDGRGDLKAGSPALTARGTNGAIKPVTSADVNRAIRTQLKRNNTSLLNEVRQTIRQTISTVDPSGWQNPQQPPTPVGIPATEPQVRNWAYIPGQNTAWQPRAYENYSFAQLRFVSSALDLLAEVISRREDEIITLKTALVAADEKTPLDPKDPIKREIEELLEFPDRVHPFATWLRMQLHEMYTIDASTTFIRRTLTGDVYSLDSISGDTITPLVDESGRSPDPPDPAYLQVIHGQPYSLFTRADGTIGVIDDQSKKELPAKNIGLWNRAELIYFPRYLRPGSPQYGFSQVEQVIFTVAIAIKSEQRRYYYESSGNMPEAMVSVPPEWNSDQIANFQAYWDNFLAGNLQRRAGNIIFVPGGMKDIAFKDYNFDDKMWEWIARVICACFHVSPTPYVHMQNRATADTASVAQIEEGLEPDKVWVRDLMNLIIRIGWGARAAHIKWAFQDDNENDVLEQAQADAQDIDHGVQTQNEVRISRGWDPYPGGVGDRPVIKNGTGYTLLEDIERQSNAATEGAEARTDNLQNPQPPVIMAPGGAKPPPNGKTPASNGKAPAVAAKPEPQSQPKQPQKPTAKKYLEYGGAHKIIKAGDFKYIEVVEHGEAFLVPINAL